MLAVCYSRVSHTSQAEGLSLPAQQERLEAYCAARGWEVVQRSDVGSGSKVNLNLKRTLIDLDAGRFGVLLVARLDRLSRSASDFFLLMDRANKQGWRIVCLDPQVDMTDPFGEAMAGMAAIFAQLERRLISQRQRESIAARKAAGTYKPAGAAAARVTPEALRRIRALTEKDLSSRAICQRLALEGYEAPSGGTWEPRTVRRYMARYRPALAA